MEAFLAYLGYSTIGIAIFYLFFKLLLSKEKSFRLNRAFILASALLPLVLPCIHLEMDFLTESPSGIATWEFLQANPSPTPPPDLKGSTSSEPISIPILSAIYIIGAVLCLFHIGILPCRALHKLISKGKLMEKQEGIRIFAVPENIPSMSWFHFVLLPEGQGKSINPHILQHEKAHIRLGHSYDLLLMDLVCLLQWFNPFAWLFLKELKAVHEYEADAAVLQSGADAKDYQYLLIEETTGRDRYHLAHSFNTNLKKRLTMIQKKKSSKWIYAKALYMIPLLAASLIAFARQPEVPASMVSTTIKPESQTAKAMPTMEATTHPAAQTEQEAFSSRAMEEEPVRVIPDKRPQYPEGFLDWLSQEIKFPESLRDAGAEATVYVGFIVRKDGGLGDIKPMKLQITGQKADVDYSLFEKEAIRVLSQSPKWIPGEQKGEKIDVQYALPIRFSIPKDSENK